MTAGDDETVLSRRWSQYMVKATSSEKIPGAEPWPQMEPESIKQHKESLAPNFETQVYVWPNPIWIGKEEIKEILTIRRNDKVVRIYPPFPVNESAETAGAFKEINLPTGGQSVTAQTSIPPSTTLGVRMTHGTPETFKPCRAFRLDVENGADGLSILRQLIDHICQYTHQWWIRAHHNPTLGPARVGGYVRKDFSIPTELKYAGAGDVEANFYGTVQYQPDLGFGSPLTRDTWLLASHHTQENRKADQALITFYDGMAEYMDGQDHKAILNLCIAVEIMLGKYFLAIHKRDAPKIEKALRKSNLVDQNTQNILSKLLTDRNSVAHGREPYIIYHLKEYTIEDYIRAVRRLVSAYLKAVPAGAWPKIMDTTLQTPAFSRTIPSKDQA